MNDLDISEILSANREIQRYRGVDSLRGLLEERAAYRDALVESNIKEVLRSIAYFSPLSSEILAKEIVVYDTEKLFELIGHHTLLKDVYNSTQRMLDEEPVRQDGWE